MFLKHKDEDLRWMIRIFGLLFYILLVYLAYEIIKPFLPSILSAIILSYLFYPLYSWLVKKLKWNSNVAASLTILVMIILFIAPLTYLIMMMIQQGFGLYSDVHGHLSFAVVNEFLQNNTFVSKYIDKNSFVYPLVISKLKEYSNAGVNWFFTMLYNFAKSIPMIFFNLFFSLFFSFFFLKEGPQIYVKSMNLIPIERRYVKRLTDEVKGLVYAIVFGSLLTVFVQGIVAMIGYRIVGINGYIVWGILTMLGAIVPVFGTGTIWIPLSLWLFLEGIIVNSNSLIIKSIFLFLYGMFVIGTIDNFIRPFLVGTQTKIHPLIILIGIVGGIAFMGVLGIFYGPILLTLAISFSKIVQEEWEER